MRVKFELKPHVLKFTFKAGTSRGTLTEKPTWFIKAIGENGTIGWGEASPLKGLSEDFSDTYQSELENLIDEVSELDVPETASELLTFVQAQVPSDKPSMRFGLETALLDLIHGGDFIIFPGDFRNGKYRMPINGLIWMADEATMQKQIEEKLKAGFNTIKMKVGAINFDQEMTLLEGIRKRYSANDITLRVDANGAFSEADVRDKLTALASLELHSIEQPIKPGRLDLMAELCEEEILPIALDEELIGVHSIQDKAALLEQTKPQYIILKPSLVGGILACKEWIEVAESYGIDWWMTSMLESNIGLNAIAQFTATYKPELPQGLGTGQLYHNNIESPLEIRRGELLYNASASWKM